METERRADGLAHILRRAGSVRHRNGNTDYMGDGMIITDEMVEKATAVLLAGGSERMRAALEAVAPDIMEACATSLGNVEVDAPSAQTRRVVEAALKAAARHIRSLKVHA